ncbi:MAG: YajQ family cyclic di-GMP-binding protein [Bacteriovoracaceae bacterium]|nr:YajQ family cyclic di-GMP-binding protein [Bacteriovoracaceae bacterium]
MPSFDLISKMDTGELKNAMNMAVKLIGSRYDFKGSKITIDFKNEKEIELRAEDDYKMGAALDIFYSSMVKRGLGLRGVEPQDVEPSGNQMLKQLILVKAGIDKEQAKIINKLIKGSGIKVSSQYLDEKVRVTGKKIDDLQKVYQMLKGHDDVKVDLQMENMK